MKHTFAFLLLVALIPSACAPVVVTSAMPSATVTFVPIVSSRDFHISLHLQDTIVIGGFLTPLSSDLPISHRV